MSDEAATSVRSSVLPAGRAIGGRYEIVGAIGEGGTGTVYLAHDLRAEGEKQRVVLKVIHRHLSGDRQIFGRFKREAAILEHLTGDHVVRLLDVVDDDGLIVIVLEHAEGRSLEDFLRERAPLAFELAVEVTLQVCAALGAAHAAGVVHRDLKPANVLVSDSPSSPGGVHVRVLDFGLAKVVHGEKMVTGLTEQDMIFGTPEYMAPEQARGEDVDARCDLYAAGVMLYEMLAGTVPFHGRTPIATMSAHLTEAPRSPREARPEVPRALEAVVLRALAKAKEERFPTARALAEALSAAREPAHVVAPSGRPVASVDLGDTDLHLEAAAVEPARVVVGRRASAAGALAATAHAAPVVALPQRHDTAVDARPAPPVEDALAPTRRAPGTAAPRGHGAWIAVAVVAVLVGIVVGVLVGQR